MALLDGLLHCHTPSLGPTGRILLDYGPRRLNGKATISTMPITTWQGNTNKWSLRGTNSGNNEFSLGGRLPINNRTVVVWWRAQVTLSLNGTRTAFFGGDNRSGEAFHLCIRNVSGSTGATVSQYDDFLNTNLANDGLWHCVAATNQDSSWKLFVDGVLVGSKSMTNSSTLASRPTILGGPTKTYWDGNIGEVAWWNRVLTPPELLEISRRGDGELGRMLTLKKSRRVRISLPVTPSVVTNTLTALNTVVNLLGQTSLLTVSRSVGVVAGSVSLTGQNVSLRLSRSLAVSNGSLNLSEQFTGLTVARSLAVDNAVINLSGQVATFNVGKALTVGSGELQFTGQSVNLAAQRNLPVAHASIVLSGQSVSMGLATQQNLTVSNASTETQGQQVTLRLTKSLFVLPAEIQTSGQITQLTVARKLMVQNGEVNLAGQDVVVRRRYELGIVGGQAAFSGEGVGLLPSRKILSAEGQIQLLGQFVTAYPVLKNAKQIFTAQLLLVTQLSDDLSFVKTLEGDSGLTLRSDQDLLLANKITGSLRLIQEITR